MCMNELQKKVDELRELRRMADDLNAEISALEDSIKAHMRPFRFPPGGGGLLPRSGLRSCR